MIYHVALIVLSVTGMYKLADAINRMDKQKEDVYLPAKWRKLNPLFRFTIKNRPVRVSAYWLQKIAQLTVLIDACALIVGRMVTKSFDFVQNSIFKYYPFVVFFIPLFYRIAFGIYIKIKEVKSKKK